MAEEVKWLTKEEQKTFIKNAKQLYEKYIKVLDKEIVVEGKYNFDLSNAIDYFVIPRNGIHKKLIYLEKEDLYCVDIASIQYEEHDVLIRVCGNPNSCKLQIEIGNTIVDYIKDF